MDVALGTKQDELENATFSPDRPSIHTKPDEFENE